MWVGGWGLGGLDDTPYSDDVVPPLVQIHLLVRRTGPLCFRSDRLACGGAFRLRSAACFARAAFASFHVTQQR